MRASRRGCASGGVLEDLRQPVLVASTAEEQAQNIPVRWASGCRRGVHPFWRVTTRVIRGAQLWASYSVEVLGAWTGLKSF